MREQAEHIHRQAGEFLVSVSSLLHFLCCCGQYTLKANEAKTSGVFVFSNARRLKRAPKGLLLEKRTKLEPECYLKDILETNNCSFDKAFKTHGGN